MGLTVFQGEKTFFKLENFTLVIEVIEDRENLSLDDLNFIFNRDFDINAPNIINGIDFDKRRQFLFNVNTISKTGVKTYTATLQSYIEFNNNETSFDGIEVNMEELNWFYNIGQSYESKLNFYTGMAEISTIPFEDTRKYFTFYLENELIEGNLNISRTISSMSKTPLKLNTTLTFYFSPTNEFVKIQHLIYLTFDFMKFITYRRNTKEYRFYLKKKNVENGKYREVAEFFVNMRLDEENEEAKIIQNRLFDFQLLEKNIGLLFEKLANNMIYLSHIPKSSTDKNIITPAKIIMTTAGFEWQFKYLYEVQSSKSANKHQEQKEEILAFLEEKINNNSGKKKKYFKKIKGLISRSDMTLSDKIAWALQKYHSVLDIFIKQLYKNEDGNYTNISERIQTERNNIAHGNIDQDFHELIIFDFTVLEWLYYAMVLSDIGMSEQNIKKSINKLFNRRLAL